MTAPPLPGIALVIAGRPDQARDCARELRHWHTRLDDAAADLARARRDLEPYWTGAAADRFHAYVGPVSTDAGDLALAVVRLAANLDAFAHLLESAFGLMSTARTLAIRSGLIVAADTVLDPAQAPPTAPVAGPYTALAPTPPPPVEAYAQCAALAAHGQDYERDAHALLRAAGEEVSASPFLATWLRRVGVLPPLDPSGVDIGGFALDKSTFLVGSVADWAIRSPYGRFAPRDAAGRYASVRDMSPWRQFVGKTKPSGWQAKAGQAANFRRASTASKWLGIAGGVAQGGMAAVDQWEEDERNRDMQTAERLGRAGTQGVATGVGAWGGAWVGVQVGGSIGSFGGPVGTAAGVVIGGAVGGLIGTGLGDVAGNALEGVFGDATQGATDLAQEGWDAVGGAAKKVGGALKFWGAE